MSIITRINKAEKRIVDLYNKLKNLPSGETPTPVDSRPYKVYTALLTQSETDAPVATVLENTLGGEVVWSRIEVGAYIATLNGVFTLNKTIGFFTYSLSQGDEIFMTVQTIDVNTLELKNRTSTVSVQDMFSGQIEIRVYN